MACATATMLTAKGIVLYLPQKHSQSLPRLLRGWDQSQRHRAFPPLSPMLWRPVGLCHVFSFPAWVVLQETHRLYKGRSILWISTPWAWPQRRAARPAFRSALKPQYNLELLSRGPLCLPRTQFPEPWS